MFSFWLSFVTPTVNLPISLLITAVCRPGVRQSFLSLDSSYLRTIKRTLAVFRSPGKHCRCELPTVLGFSSVVLLLPVSDPFE